MNNFYAYNPVKIIFGKDMIARIAPEVAGFKKILLLSGGGSIKANGVHDQIMAALKDFAVIEFSGIEPNPEYNTCMRALALAREENADFILAAGGGSVMDAAKFIAMAYFGDDDPWDYVTRIKPAPAQALPFGCISTLAASGSEYNNAFVISRHDLKRKIGFNAINLYPRFSVLDPQTTLSLPWDRTAEGVCDMLVHVLEQYVTAPAQAPLQDRQAESLIATIMETGLDIRSEPQDYDLRATLMWCAATAVNGTISRGVPVDWATHMIGHEVTALYGTPHARTLTVLLGGVYRQQLVAKSAKLAQLGRRLLGTSDPAQVIESLEDFFFALGMPTRFSHLNLHADDAAAAVCAQLAPGFAPLGENKSITLDDVGAIIRAQA